MLLQWVLPHANTAPIASSTISEEEDLLSVWIRDVPLVLTPMSKGSNLTFGSVSRRTD
jgi:hypothetical protein